MCQRPFDAGPRPPLREFYPAAKISKIFAAPPLHISEPFVGLFAQCAKDFSKNSLPNRGESRPITFVKSIFILLGLVAMAITLPAQDTNPPAMSGEKLSKKIGTLEATNFIDQEVTVTGRVVQVTARPSVTFLNLDKSYPDSPFTVVIFRGRSQFNGDAELLKGKAIEVRGKIKNFKDKPEMTLETTNQLIVVGATNMSMFFKPMTAPSSPTNAPAAPPAVQVTNFPEVM